VILYTIIILTVIIFLFVNFAPVFGGKPSGQSLSRIEKSQNSKDGKFQNLVATKFGFSKGQDFNPKYNADESYGKKPSSPLPTIKFDKSNFENNEENMVTWFGHSTILFKIENRIIVTDPVFNNASPLPFIGPAPFKYENNLIVEDLPNKIDVVLITHNHYDHLDHKTIKTIHPNVEKFLVPIGVKAHLLKWGLPDNKIKEFDWYDIYSFKEIDFIFTPTRHFSGRALRDRFATLWGGWIIKSDNSNLYISGDGGYSSEFKKIGEAYGPFDIVFIENGAYNRRWEEIHLFPEQGVQASLEARAKVALPIHWGKFNLSSHSWIEPIDRFVKEAKKRNLTIVTPYIGQTFNINGEIPNENWWNNLQ